MRMRTLMGFLAAPPASAVVFSIVALPASPAFAMGVLVMGTFYSYAISLTLGVPVHCLLMRIRATSRVYYMCSALLLGLIAPVLAISQSMMTVDIRLFIKYIVVEWAVPLSFSALWGAFNGYVFWRIARPDLPLDEFGEV